MTLSGCCHGGRSGGGRGPAAASPARAAWPSPGGVGELRPSFSRKSGNRRNMGSRDRLVGTGLCPQRGHRSPRCPRALVGHSGHVQARGGLRFEGLQRWCSQAWGQSWYPGDPSRGVLTCCPHGVSRSQSPSLPRRPDGRLGLCPRRAPSATPGLGELLGLSAVVPRAVRAVLLRLALGLRDHVTPCGVFFNVITIKYEFSIKHVIKQNLGQVGMRIPSCEAEDPELESRDFGVSDKPQAP